MHVRIIDEAKAKANSTTKLSTVGMSQQLGNEVERQGKANKSTKPRTALYFQRKEELPWVGFEPTN